MAKKVVLIARDAAPSGCFKRLAVVLEERGLDVALFVGDGKPLLQEVREIGAAIVGANVLVLGMSSSASLAQGEVELGRIAKKWE